MSKCKYIVLQDQGISFVSSNRKQIRAVQEKCPIMAENAAQRLVTCDGETLGVMGRVRDIYDRTVTSTWDREGRICETNIGKGSVLRVKIEIGILGKRARVVYCRGNSGGWAGGA